MAQKIIRTSHKDVVEVMKELSKDKHINCGIDEIEFPDGQKEKFYYNGEEDRQSAIRFAEVCVNATESTYEAKIMMATCFNLMTHGIKPARIVKLENDITTYLDEDKKALYNGLGQLVVELSEEEKNLELSLDALEVLLKTKAKAQALEEEARYNHYCDDCDDYDCDLDDESEDDDDDDDRIDCARP